MHDLSKRKKNKSFNDINIVILKTHFYLLFILTPGYHKHRDN